MFFPSWNEAILKNFYTSRILKTYALTINGVVKITLQNQTVKYNIVRR